MSWRNLVLSARLKAPSWPLDGTSFTRLVCDGVPREFSWKQSKPCRNSVVKSKRWRPGGRHQRNGFPVTEPTRQGVLSKLAAVAGDRAPLSSTGQAPHVPTRERMLFLARDTTLGDAVRPSQELEVVVGSHHHVAGWVERARHGGDVGRCDVPRDELDRDEERRRPVPAQ